MPARKKPKPAPAFQSEIEAPEYRFDYSQSKPNRYAQRAGMDVVAIVLDDDVARVFHDSRQVNDLLRAAINAVQAPRTRRAG